MIFLAISWEWGAPFPTLFVFSWCHCTQGRRQGKSLGGAKEPRGPGGGGPRRGPGGRAPWRGSGGEAPEAEAFLVLKSW